MVQCTDKTYYPKILLELFIAIFFSFTLTAQTFNYKIYTPADGLPSGSIGRILADSYGYLWITSCGGLTRYDGKKFTNFGLQDGLPFLCNAPMIEDREHQVWCTSNNNRNFSIVKFSEGKFTELPFDEHDFIEYIFSMTETPEGSIQAATSDGVFELQQNHWKKIMPVKDPPGIAVRQVLYLKDGSTVLNYWYNIVLKRKDGAWKIIADTALCKWYNNIELSNDKIIITGTNRLFMYDSGVLHVMYDDIINGQRLFTSAIDSKGRVLVPGEKDGFMIFDKDRLSVFSLADGLPNTLITGICEDREGAIWLGNFKGLIRLLPSNVSAYTTKAGLASNDVRSIFMTKAGDVFFGNNGPGQPFSIYNRQKKISANSVPAHNKILSSVGIITSLAEDERGRIWIANYGEGLLRYEKNHIEDISAIVGDNRYASVKVLFDASDSSVIVNTDSGLLKIQDDHIKEYLTVKAGGKTQEVFYGYIDRKGNLWVSTFADFGIYDRQKKIFYASGLNLNHTVAGDFAEDKQGNIWTGIAGKGVCKIEYDKAKHISLSLTLNEKNGLPDNIIQDIAFDSTGNLWVASSNGVTRFDMQHKNAAGNFAHQTFSVEDGITAKSLTDATLLADKNNDVWLSTTDGLFRINTNNIIADTLPPMMQVEKVMLMNDSSDWNNYAKLFSDYFHFPVNPLLPYNKNNITIYYNGISFIKQNDIIYQYRLDGLNSSYTLTSAAYASFINLAPGTYTLYVQCRKKNTAWSQEALFSFTITPPFWDTWWFRLLTIIAASSLLIFAFRFRLQQIRKSNTIQQQIKDLELKALKAQMNPHFIYNAMNSIQSLVINDQPEQAVRYLGKFAKLLRQVLDNSDKSVIPLEHELAALQLYIELEALRLHINFDYDIKVAETLTASEERVPPLVLQP